MGYKKARRLFQYLIGAVIVFEVVALCMYMLPTVSKILSAVGIFCCVGAIVVELALCKCENCGRHLSGKFKNMEECPFCGNKFK